ncbi:hypothetical protein INT47_009728 [Mucor saturninus]|uniref:Uncharacterized protein n=1 Tax=Mucor saturninus TaxID=64648 RepID=A0A8H7QT06_9FUNG|nr:hypothetical protein INT47_009728 [Mucor saturninus]
MDIRPYCSIPDNVTVPIETYKTVIQESVSEHGVKWNFNKRPDVPTGRQRQPTYVFREYYACHRSSSKKEHAGVVRGDALGQVRGWQKRSKKIKCPATLRVVCLPGSPSMVTANLQCMS